MPSSVTFQQFPSWSYFCAHFFFFFVVQINYISLTFLAGPIFFTFWHLAIKLDCCRHHIVMVTTEPNDADGWNISIINDGKHFLKIHPLYKGRDECLVLLISPILLQAFVNWCLQGHWSWREERGHLGNFHLFFQTQSRNDSCCLSDLLKIAPHKEHFFVCVIVYTGFVL